MVKYLKIDFRKYSYERCFQQKLVYETQPNEVLMFRHFKIADYWLTEAEKNFTVQAFDSCLMAAYITIYRATKAILAKDGFKAPKSPNCVTRYLERIYVQKKHQLKKELIYYIDYLHDLTCNLLYNDIPGYRTTEDMALWAKGLAKNILNELKILSSE